MIRMLLAATALTLGAGLASAQDSVETLRGPVIEKCKADMGGGRAEDAAPAEAFCSCMVDGIIAGFGDDTLPMLKVLNSGLKESDTAGIATLLGISEDEVKAFIARVEAKFDPLNDACSAQLGGEP